MDEKKILLVINQRKIEVSRKIHFLPDWIVSIVFFVLKKTFFKKIC